MYEVKLAKEQILLVTVVSDFENIQGLGPSAQLFHYTNANGLFGILKDHVLWATEVGFLNDKSEYIFGQSVITQALGAKKDGFRERLADLWWLTTENLTALPIFVASMCEEGDLLSQWRGYSRLHDGYAVAFSAANLARKSPFRLKKAIYSRAAQEKLIDNVLDAGHAVYSKVDPSDQEEILRQTMIALLVEICSFKDESFQGEKEWRLVAMGSNSETKFRVVSGHIAPYVDITLERSDLLHIVQGPGNFRKANAKAVEQFASSCKFEGLNVAQSRVPVADF